MSSSKEEFSKLAQQLEKFLRSKLSNDVSITGSLARLHGGFDTDTYAFSIENPPLNFPHELVLRHYQTRGESMRVVFESTMQSVARNAGHPVAHVPIDSSGHLLDNRPFLIMERLPWSALGDLLGDQSVLQQLPQIMAKLQLGLHKINSSGLKSKLEESGVNIEFMSPLIMLKRVTALANACKEPKLLTVNSWLVDNWPNQPQTPTICHGDFHTNNILYLDGKVTGLIDWGNVMFTHPEFDVAVTRLILSNGPPESDNDASAALRPMINRLIAEYIAIYRKQSSLDDTLLDYYAALRSAHAYAKVIGDKRGVDLPYVAGDGYAWALPQLFRTITRVIENTTGLTLESG